MMLESDNLPRLDPEISASIAAGEDEGRVNYDAVLARVFERIDKADALGPLAAIKAEEIMPISYWEGFERKLNDRVREFREYDQPVQECIADEQPLSDTAAIRVASSVSRRADAVEKQPAWEQVLRSDEVLPAGDWERVEAKISQRFDAAQEQGPRISWPLVGFSWLGSGVGRLVGSGVTIVVAAVVAGWLMLGTPSQPTFVYQTSGAIDPVSTGEASSGLFTTESRSAMTVVNKHGFVRIGHGAELRVEGVTNASARYRLTLAAGGNADAEFYFERATDGASYRVDLDQFRIEVTGTYFSVNADSGRITTTVLEGHVLIHPAQGVAMRIAAGQSCIYDMQSGGWTKAENGMVVERDSIEKTPSLDVLARSVACTFGTSDPAQQCEIVIDGRRVGLCPAMILLTPGIHAVSMRSGDQAHIDTSIDVAAQGPHEFVFAVPVVASFEVAARVESLRTERNLVADVPTASPQALSGDYSHADSLMRAARSFGRSQWRQAAGLYSEVLNGTASEIQKQNALFALGTIHADYAQDRGRARQYFAEYRAKYATGIFGGEVLLRLAELSIPGQRDSAIAYYRQYIQVAGGSLRTAEVRYQLGLLLLQSGRGELAVTELEQALTEAQEKSPELKQRIAQSLVRALDEQSKSARAAEIRRQYLSSASGR